jgi:predicted nucleotidyltransferase
MNAQDPNVAKVELIARALGPLREQVVFVGGCAAGLLIADPTAAPSRVTYDVDLAVQVAALRDYQRLEAEFVQLGFRRDMASEVICRWRYQDLEVDLMPSDPGVLGFANRWYPVVVETAQLVTLPSGTDIRLITAPAFLATKFEAHADRGNKDLLGSHDLEDIANVLGGRSEIAHEISLASRELRSYLGARCRELLATPNFMDYLPGMIFPDEWLSERVAALAQRLRQIAEFE